MNNNVNSTRRGFLLATGILAIISAVGFGLYAMFYGLIALIALIESTTWSGWGAFWFLFFGGWTVFVLAISIATAVVSFRSKDLPEERLNKGFILTLAILNLISFNTLVGAFLIVAYCVKDRPDQRYVNNQYYGPNNGYPQQNSYMQQAQQNPAYTAAPAAPQDEVMVVAMKNIEQVKDLCKKGIITKAEQDKMVNDIVTTYLK